MAQFAYIVTALALAGALASWVFGVVYYVQTLRSISASPEQRNLMARAIFGWMFTVRHLKGAAAEQASKVNKALVAFIVCAIVAVSAMSVGTNLARVPS